MLRWDQHRADYINAKLSGELPQDDDLPVVKADSTVVNHEGVIQPNVGTSSAPNQSMLGSQMSIDPEATGRNLPGVRQTMVLDTASDVAWVQCHPQASSYDPTRSSTYAAFACNSPACAQLGPYAGGCVNNQCQYNVTYADGSSTSGTYSSDVLTINPASAATAISNFQFGCSRAERGSFGGRSVGIMALGGGTESLASQTAATHGNAFAYCIPTPSSRGFFVLGAPSRAASRYVVTPMLRDPRAPTFYRVLLRAITVGGQRLNIAPAVFAAGTVLDSRTAITRLPPTAYRALRAAFRSAMRAYRAAPPRGALDTCYDFTGVAVVRLPRVTLVFDRNAAVELDPAGILFNGCLAFAANGNDRMPGILGNVQQQRIEVLYNVGGGSVGFRRGAC